MLDLASVVSLVEQNNAYRENSEEITITFKADLTA